VEALGIGYLLKLGGRLLGYGDKAPGNDRLHYSLDATLSEKIDMAANILRGMSLTKGFAGMVIFTGHGSTTTNNPYASALECGACGGHAGDVNARIAAALLNDPFVRAGLLQHNINIPAETVFVAAVHNTTTDDIFLLDVDAVPESHRALLAQVKAEFKRAGEQVRSERAVSLGDTADTSAVKRRARDWSQVRPEWGLAGCASFIAAPRVRTRSLALDGRCFLHDYRETDDPDHAVLETLLTAPLVVASWITLQYYASTVDNRHFGSGDKTLHNVVGGIGVLEGMGGGLRSGLPMQSLHNGREFVHEPLRLTAVVEACRHAIDDILDKHESLSQLVDNGWIQLHALDQGAVWRRDSGGRWGRLLEQPSTRTDRSEAA
jgi:uncharacterized protein YbcC (UPF0753/DUF2309 family)